MGREVETRKMLVFFLAQGRIHRKKRVFLPAAQCEMAKITWVRHGSGSERPEKVFFFVRKAEITIRTEIITGRIFCFGQFVKIM